jgi:hypothetical protein
MAGTSPAMTIEVRPLRRLEHLFRRESQAPSPRTPMEAADRAHPMQFEGRVAEVSKRAAGCRLRGSGLAALQAGFVLSGEALTPRLDKP